MEIAAQTQGNYRFGGNEPGPITLSNIDDEGYVQPVLTQAGTPGADGVDTIYVPESLCQWQGWSLSAPPPATPFDTGDTSAPVTAAAQNLPAVDVQFEPARGSLPYLRFGNYYQLRARTVDLAGNSLSMSEADAVMDALERNHREVPVLPAKPNEFQYRRFDPLGAPVVVLCSKLTEGETPDLLVIRSNRGQSAAQYAADLGDPKYKAVNERHIVPAKASQLSAEAHGELDGAFGNAGDPDRFYNICLRERGSLEDTAVVNITTGNSEPLPDVPVQTSSSGDVTVVRNGICKLAAPGSEASYVIHYEKMLRLPYLPDPAVRGAALFGLPGVRGQTGELNASGALDFSGPQVLPPAARDALGDVTKISFGPANAWPELLPFKLQLDEDRTLGQESLPEWDRVKRILKVRMRPGETRTIWLSSYPAAEDIDANLFGLHYWWSIRAGSAAEQREFLNTARHGALSMLSPAHKLTLVHAVQQPLRLAAAGGRLYDTVTITKAHLARGSTARLRKGDVWTLQDLLYGMLLVSGNDAALAIADHVGRTQEKKRGDPRKRFVREMGSAATTLGARNAHFADPYGISPANVATARDVGLIAAKIFTDPRLLPAWQCPERTLNIGGPAGRSVTLKTTLEILGEDNVVGAKTGTHVGKNIYNLVTAWRAPNGETVVAVVLGAADNSSRYEDVRTILAAVPHDFSKLAEPVAGAAHQNGKVSCP